MSLRGETRTEFPQSVRKKAFARACLRCDVAGVDNIPGRPQCENCGKEVFSGGFIYEHVTPDGLGGEPTLENCKVHCNPCAKVKTFTEDNPRMAKADRALKKSFGLMPTKRQQIKSPGFAKAAPQRRASGAVNKWRGF
jgi:5-methylcytosine-specific restriction endonuclease McrA